MTHAHRRDVSATSALAGNGERGVALVLSLLVLVVISLVAVVLMSTLNSDRRAAGRTAEHSQASNYAEAGVEEALAQIRHGEIPNDLNPRMVSQIFLASAGSVPVLGTDSIALPTDQPAEAGIGYSTPEKSPDALTIQYKTNADHTEIYRYDASLPTPVQTATGVPIYTITSTGRVGDDRHRVVTEVFAKPIPCSVHAALAADQPIHLLGRSEVCGFNHRIDTPSGTRIATPCTLHHTGSGDLPGSWSTHDIATVVSSHEAGAPVSHQANQTGFYEGPWQALGMGPADFFSWVGAPVSVLPSDPQGIYYVGNDCLLHGGDGEGFLYVAGDLAIDGNFQYRGLIYVGGDLELTGTCWILGSIIVKGTTDIKIANRNCTILYSKDAIEQTIAKHGGQFVTLSWRETQ